MSRLVRPGTEVPVEAAVDGQGGVEQTRPGSPRPRTQFAGQSHRDRALVFPRAGGGPWRDHDWRSWRRRGYQPVARSVGLQSPRPYDRRGSFVSLLIQEGRTVVDVAAQAGHAAETCVRHYARLFRDAPAA